VSDYPGGWFGASWRAPVCEEERHKPTPVGSECAECHLGIEEADQGMLIPYAHDDTVELQAIHLACFLATILPKRGTVWR
jgi:hypothetical protein